MARKSYYEKLKDPRWQRKRLEVLHHYEFTCRRCFDTESTLHVHHKEYFKNREPWEYEVDQLTVLCESCHESHHHDKDIFKYVSSYLDFDGPRDRDQIAMIIAGYVGLNYADVLKDSPWEDCALTRAWYDLGKKVADMPFDWRSFVEEEKPGADNG